MRSYVYGLAATLFAVTGAGSALAQDAERTYEPTTIWTVGYARTKPGHFNDYMQDLSRVYRAYLDAQKKDGVVLSYKILNVQSPRDGEPNVIFLVEYPNWAAFDKSDAEYFEKLAARLQGSIPAAAQANIDREALRSLHGGLIAQELVFK